jgi:hypothetical protein
MLKALTDECLIRSLGFPEVQRISQKSILFPFNSLKKTAFPIGHKISEFDALMIRTLYSSKVKSGMTVRNFIQSLELEE